MYNKIVDMVAVTARTKPMGGGKCEQWWRENSTGRHGLDRKAFNRSASGRTIPGAMSPSVEETLTRFKFKGFEFGNWLSQAERYDVFRAFQFCLADMIKWLGTNNFGVDNQIGVAFGARGSGKALAHYEPTTNIINMTKKKGAGSLLHEYAHALDYTIGAFIDQCARYTSLSGGREKEQKSDNVGCQFRAMMNKILNYVRSTESFTKLKKITHDSDYWCNSTELFARLTESYYAYYHNDSHNYYLVKPTSFYERSYGIYLSKAEMDVIKPELDKFWKEVGLLLNDKCKLKATPYPKDTAVKKKTETKTTDIKKKTLKRPDKFDFDFGKFVSRDIHRPTLMFTHEVDNYRVAADMFVMAYEELGDSLKEGYVRQFDKKNQLVYSGKLSESTVSTIAYPKVRKVLAIEEKKKEVIDTKKLTKSIEDLKEIVKKNKEKLKKLKEGHVKNDEYWEAEIRSRWMDYALFVIGGVTFNYRVVSLMLYVYKMWKLNTLYIESPYRACLMRSGDHKKMALFMPMSIEHDRTEKESKMLKEKGFYVFEEYM